MQWNLEVVPVCVSDVDRAKQFYAEQVGFHLDFDRWVSEEHRVVQLTPPGSGSSIQLKPGETRLDGLQLVVFYSDPDGNAWVVQECPAGG